MIALILLKQLPFIKELTTIDRARDSWRIMIVAVRWKKVASLTSFTVSCKQEHVPSLADYDQLLTFNGAFGWDLLCEMKRIFHALLRTYFCFRQRGFCQFSANIWMASAISISKYLS